MCVAVRGTCTLDAATSTVRKRVSEPVGAGVTGSCELLLYMGAGEQTQVSALTADRFLQLRMGTAKSGILPFDVVSSVCNAHLSPLALGQWFPSQATSNVQLPCLCLFLPWEFLQGSVSSRLLLHEGRDELNTFVCLSILCITLTKHQQLRLTTP